MRKPSLHYTDSGDAGHPAIVFIHAFPFTSAMWKEQTTLCLPHFRVITYDHRGLGQSSGEDSPYLFEFLVDDLLELMDRLHLEKTILCGMSMGGYLALRAQERMPDRFSGLLLCDTRSEADSDAAKLKRAADLRLIQVEGLATFADKFIRNALSPSNLGNASLVDRVKRMILGNSVEGVQNALISLATRTDTTASLNAIHVPTLILVGSDDVITPPVAASALHERILKSDMAIIPHAGHLSNLDNPVVFNQHLEKFLSGFRV